MKHTPERTCLGCGTKQAQPTLLRLVCSPQGAILLDHSGRFPGRGAYICVDVRCLRKALKPAKLASAFRQAVVPPSVAALCGDITGWYRTRLEVCIQLARKAGVVVSGYAALQKALAQRQVAYMIVATDIAVTRAESYYAWCERLAIPYVVCCSKHELGRLMDRPSRSALGFTEQCFAERLHTLMAAAERWHASHRASEGRTAFSYTAS
jgi:predicted RNA-binding protein YlxR (DUF448 family)/ribosomal protein L7Ae-like RNA K-turn-binding protein